jgi:hypothetical protein
LLSGILKVNFQIFIYIIIKTKVVTLSAHLSFAAPGCGTSPADGALSALGAWSHMRKMKLAAKTDRRLRTRFPLGGPLSVDDGGNLLEGVSVDVSAAGLGCLLGEPIPAGEIVACRFPIGVPPRSAHAGRPVAEVQCRARVVRVEAGRDGYFVGLRILSYRLESAGPSYSATVQ